MADITELNTRDVVKVDELLGKTQEEIKKTIALLTEDEAKALEEELVEISNTFSKELVDKNFDMPSKGYKDAATAIQTILNKQSVTWQYTSGLIAIYDFFNPAKREKTIPYAILDSVLQTFGRIQFTGYDEWKAVVTINKYFEPLQKEYAELQNKIYAYAGIHNEIMSKLGLNTAAAANPKA